jgi:hypothetical protein
MSADDMQDWQDDLKAAMERWIRENRLGKTEACTRVAKEQPVSRATLLRFLRGYHLNAPKGRALEAFLEAHGYPIPKRRNGSRRRRPSGPSFGTTYA